MATFAIALLMLAPSPDVAGQGFALTAMELLDQYEQGNPAAPRAFSGVIHVESVKDALNADGERWIEAAGPKDVARRRLVAATFALETARAGLDHEWANSVQLIDWGWSQLSKQRPPLPAERLWHLAAIALFEGAHDEELLGPRLRRIKSRFPDEARVALAEAWRSEALQVELRPLTKITTVMTPSVTVNVGPPLRGKPGGIGAAGADVIGAYTKALANPNAAIAGEADLRLGYYDLIADKSESALSRFAHAQSTTKDPNVLYLVHLFRGWMLTRMGRENESTAEYRQAVDALPEGGTAALWLAGRLIAEGKRAEADAIVDRSLTGGRDVPDPWRLFGYGDFYHFPALMTQLREAIR